jgi:hypothetical protein
LCHSFYFIVSLSSDITVKTVSCDSSFTLIKTIYGPLDGTKPLASQVQVCSFHGNSSTDKTEDLTRLAVSNLQQIAKNLLIPLAKDLKTGEINEVKILWFKLSY